MDVTFLGTGTSQGVPVIACDCQVCSSPDPRDSRTRSSILVEDNGSTIVIDTGPDFRNQMLREKVKDITAVLLTHDHKDHMAGLDDVRPFNFKHNKYIDVYCEKNVSQSLKREFAYVFDNQTYPGVPLINIKHIDEKPFSIGETCINPIRVIHKQLPILGFRIGDFAYITDASYISLTELSKLSHLRVMVINALRKEKHYSHFNLDDALSIINYVKPQEAYLTHISHNFGLYEQESTFLPDGVMLAYDGLKISI